MLPLVGYTRRMYSRRLVYSAQSRLSVCLFVRALKGKRLELSTPNFVRVYSIAVARHALTQRSKGQRSRSHGYENRHGRTVASDACCYGRVLLLPAWVCMSIRLPVFSSSFSIETWVRVGKTLNGRHDRGPPAWLKGSIHAEAHHRARNSFFQKTYRHTERSIWDAIFLLIFICSIAIAYSMGQIIKSFCV